MTATTTFTATSSTGTVATRTSKTMEYTWCVFATGATNGPVTAKDRHEGVFGWSQSLQGAEVMVKKARKAHPAGDVEVRPAFPVAKPETKAEWMARNAVEVIEVEVDAELAVGGAARKVCYCGCDQTVTRFYRPGHDAKHLAYLVSFVKDAAHFGPALIAATNELPTEALQDKLAKRLDAV